MKKWFFDADYLQACNCDYGCPCEFSAPPTTGFCHGLGVWKIDRGKYDELSLDGLGLGFAAKWPKAIHEGHGTVCLFVDEKASAEQREALLDIGSGKAGGLPFEIHGRDANLDVERGAVGPEVLFPYRRDDRS